MVICAMKHSEDAYLVLDYLRGTPVKVIVNTFEDFEAEGIRRAGGYPIQTSLASAQRFVEWLDVNAVKGI
jgi:hypothetical protein